MKILLVRFLRWLLNKFENNHEQINPQAGVDTRFIAIVDLLIEKVQFLKSGEAYLNHPQDDNSYKEAQKAFERDAQMPLAYAEALAALPDMSDVEISYLLNKLREVSVTLHDCKHVVEKIVKIEKYFIRRQSKKADDNSN